MAAFTSLRYGELAALRRRGTVYVALVVDADSRGILGWRAMSTPLILDALEQAIWERSRAGMRDLTGLVHHTDAGSLGEQWSLWITV